VQEWSDDRKIIQSIRQKTVQSGSGWKGESGVEVPFGTLIAFTSYGIAHRLLIGR
jgi:hypothetical protein